MKVGDQVWWVDAYGDTRFGAIDEITGTGRVYVSSIITNTHGRRVTRVSKCWFDPHEVGRLTVSPLQ